MPNTQPLTMPSRVPRHAAEVTAALLIASVLLALSYGGLDALKAAGIVGTAPAGAGAFKTMIETLNANLMWVFSICVGLAISVGGVLMAFGHSRAQDQLIRIGGGIAVLLVGAPAILA